LRSHLVLRQVAAGFYLSLCLLAFARADSLRRIGTIQVPGASAAHPFDVFDSGLVASRLNQYLLSNISMKSVDVFEASTGKFLYRVPGFFGYQAPCCERVGPGSLELTGDTELWATDADSSIKIIDLAARKIIESLSTGGHLRTDAMAYDSRDDLMAVNNPDDAVPFVTFVSTHQGHAILGKIDFPRASAGLEASVWSPRTGLYYLAIPETDRNHMRGAIAVIDPVKQSVLRTIPIERCGPNSVALGPNDQLLIGCRGAARGNDYGFTPKTFMMDVRIEKVESVADINGSDQTCYNPGDGRYYLSALGNPGGPVLATIEAARQHRVLTAPSQHFAHSVAVDPVTNRAFVPFSSTPTDHDCMYGCIALYSVVGNGVSAVRQ
jgi:hypothetical protein